MKPLRFQIGVTIDSDAATTLIELIQQAVQKGTAQLVQSRAVPLGTREPDSQRKPQMTPLERSQHALFGGQKATGQHGASRQHQGGGEADEGLGKDSVGLVE